MIDYIKLYKQEPFKIQDTEWFEVTRTNYEYQRRKMFSSKGNVLTQNQYFPFEEMKRLDLNFNSYYIAAFTDVEDNGCIDYDYSVGFNRLGIDHELSLIFNYLSKPEEVCLLISKKTQWNLPKSIDPLFDIKSDKFIERCFDVVNKYGGKDTEYIIKATDVKTAKCLVNILGGI